MPIADCNFENGEHDCWRLNWPKKRIDTEVANTQSLSCRWLSCSENKPAANFSLLPNQIRSVMAEEFQTQAPWRYRIDISGAVTYHIGKLRLLNGMFKTPLMLLSYKTMSGFGPEKTVPILAM